MGCLFSLLARPLQCWCSPLRSNRAAGFGFTGTRFHTPSRTSVPLVSGSEVGLRLLHISLDPWLQPRQLGLDIHRMYGGYGGLKCRHAVHDRHVLRAVPVCASPCKAAELRRRRLQLVDCVSLPGTSPAGISVSILLTDKDLTVVHSNARGLMGHSCSDSWETCCGRLPAPCKSSRA